MNSLLLRTTAILLHAIANFLIVTALLNYDLTGSWLYFTVFVAIVVLLIIIFVKHLLSFYYFIKTKTK